MFRRTFLTFCLFVFLAACTPGTPIVMPTVAHMPNTATPSELPIPDPTISSPTLESATPTQPQASPTLESTPDSVPTETALPLPTLNLPPTMVTTAIPQPSPDSGVIQFLGPGPLSKIVSPVRVYGYAVPGYHNKGTLELYGEDGNLLASQLLQLNTPYKWANFYWEMPFDINSVGELGRLTLTTQDEYGRVNAVNSVHLLLLSEGSSILNQPGNLKERCVIVQPAAGQRLAGGVLTVVGKMRPYNALPLILELTGRDGSVIGTQTVNIVPVAGDDYIPFRVDMPYRISQSMWALLSVRQNDDRIGGVMYLYSQELFLNP